MQQLLDQWHPNVGSLQHQFSKQHCPGYSLTRWFYFLKTLFENIRFCLLIKMFALIWLMPMTQKIQTYQIFQKSYISGKKVQNPKIHQISHHLMENFSFRNFRCPTHDTQLTPIFEFINFRIEKLLRKSQDPRKKFEQFEKIKSKSHCSDRILWSWDLLRTVLYNWNWWLMIWEKLIVLTKPRNSVNIPSSRVEFQLPSPSNIAARDSWRSWSYRHVRKSRTITILKF